MVAALRKEVRQDPQSRPTHGWSPAFHQLKGRDPRLKYVWVSKASEDLGPDYYESLGYQVIRYEEKGGIVLGSLSRRPGEPITFRGNVLMGVDLERAAEIDQYGPDGGSGQEYCDQIASQIANKKFIPSELRQTPGFLSVDRDMNNDLNPTEKANG